MGLNRRNQILVICAAVLLCCCLSEAPKETEQTTTTTTESTILQTTTTTTTSTTETMPARVVALTKLDYFRYNKPEVRSHALSITEGCINPECSLLRIYKYAIDNFYYKNYDNPENSMRKLFTDGYGTAADFTSFYYNYMKAVGITSYVAAVGDHKYALACDINLTRLQGYIEEDSALREYVNDHSFPNFEFETNRAFNKTCIRIEAPSATKGYYRYPGEHYPGLRIEADKSFFFDPEKGLWELFEQTDQKIEASRAHIVRTLKFSLPQNSAISWNIKVVTKRVDGGLDYEFYATDIKLHTEHNYATFTLLEMSRFDRAKVRITINGTNPFTFFTLQDKNQFEGFKYIMEKSIKEADENRIDQAAHKGTWAWEFDYINSCSQTTNTTFFDRECLLTDAGRRLFAIHNEGLFKQNNITVTIRYVEFLQP